MKPLAFVIVGCLALNLVGAGNARAESPAAEALFEAGVSLSERGMWSQACAKFEASEELDVAVGTLLRLADCYERTRRLASAWSRFREAASLAQAQTMPERARIAEIRAEALRWKMARLTVNVPSSAPAGYSVQLNGSLVPRASWGSGLPIDSGSFTLEASAPGYVTFRRKVAVPSVEAARVQLTVPRLDAQPVLAPPPARFVRQTVHRVPAAASASGQQPRLEDRGYAARVVGATFAAVGGAGLATSGVLAVLAAKRSEHSLDHCGDDGQSCTPRGAELRHEADKLEKAAMVSAAAGGGLLVTGFVVYTTAPRGHAAEHVSISAVPDAATRGASLQLRGAF